jgi:hypothetical protein
MFYGFMFVAAFGTTKLLAKYMFESTDYNSGDASMHLDED